MTDKIIITCTVTKQEDPLLFDLLKNIKPRLRATYIRIFATEHIIRRHQNNIIMVQQSSTHVDREMHANTPPNNYEKIASISAEQNSALGNLGELFSELADSNSLFI
jgi:hypothetical protein